MSGGEPGVTLGQQGQQLGRETLKGEEQVQAGSPGPSVPASLCLPNPARLHFWPTLTLKHSTEGILGNIVPSVNMTSAEEYSMVSIMEEREIKGYRASQRSGDHEGP